MTQTFFARPAVLALAGVLATLSVPAFAADAATVPAPGTVETHATVATDGLDLASDAGLAALHARVARAAEEVCRPEGNTPVERRYAATCLRRATAKGIAEVDALHDHALAMRQLGNAMAAQTPAPAASPATSFAAVTTDVRPTR